MVHTKHLLLGRAHFSPTFPTEGHPQTTVSNKAETRVGTFLLISQSLISRHCTYLRTGRWGEYLNLEVPRGQNSTYIVAL
jgi:hypothetical protein